MMYFPKSMPPPSCLEKEKEKADGDYKCGNVLQRLKTDFENKCYICEFKEPPTINVEHFVPHKGNKDLKFNWANLFWACARCNNIKGDRFDNILYCTHPEHDVENWLRYEIGEEFLTTTVNISVQHEHNLVANTAELLLKVYNGTTPLKIIEAENIRNVLSKEIADFRRSLNIYEEGVEDDEVLEFHLENIKKHLCKSSAFTAFKRWIIKDNPNFREEFEKYFD